MDYEEALDVLTERYNQREDVEFPKIFELCDFHGKTVLEIGAGRTGLFIKEAKKICKDYLATDISADTLEGLKKSVDVKTQVVDAENLPFPDNSFDIIFSRWVTQGIENLEKAIKEMCRVARESVMVVLPNEEGDETEMLRIIFPDKYEFRKNRRLNIRRWMEECGLKVREDSALLKFVFKDVDEALETQKTLAFSKGLTSEQEEKIKEFFRRNQKQDGVHFMQGAAFICGSK